MGAIYRAICKKNGKVYVGQTVKESWSKRYIGDESKKARSNQRRGITLRYFENAILKHGWENFEFRDLVTAARDEDLDALEKFFIRHYRSNEAEHGYNCTDGGDAPKTVSQASIRKIQERTSKRTLWEHPKLGSLYASAAELMRAFPDHKLHSVRLGELRRGGGATRQCKGWWCPMSPQKPRKIADSPRMWVFRSTGRRIFATPREMALVAGTEPEAFTQVVTHSSQGHCRGWDLHPKSPQIAQSRILEVEHKIAGPGSGSESAIL